ncbi:MAG: SDR family oxidoreductase [Deltaproteobacteria bacterium]|nr:SDR family oxidoreductase [Deltaproteobacteria bacterium]
MEKFFEGKVAVVTGGGRGIGEYIARDLAKTGCRVALVARSTGEIEKVEEGIRAGGGEALCVPGDVRDPSTALLACRTAVEKFGRLDIIVNCAGVFIPTEARKFSPEAYRDVIETNLLGTIYFCQAAVEHMVPRRFGRVVNISSLAGKMTFAQSAAYSASKFAVIAYSDRLRSELHKTGIKVTTVMPGFIDTAMLDKFRKSVPNDLYLRATKVVPEKVSGVVVAAIPKGKPDVYITGWDTLMVRFVTRAPRLADVFARLIGIG